MLSQFKANQIVSQHRFVWKQVHRILQSHRICAAYKVSNEIKTLSQRKLGFDFLQAKKMSGSFVIALLCIPKCVQNCTV